MFKIKKAFIPFVVIGDPNYETSKEIIKTLIDAGADMLELGFAFSDPVADGPTIQLADNRALKSKISTDEAFKLIKEIKDYSGIPISILVYSNLIYQKNINDFYKQGKECGVDGVLVADVPYEESLPYVEAANKYNIAPIFLVAQTTTKKRLNEILKLAKGYIYVVSILGVTGTRIKIEEQTINLIKNLKKQTNLPLAVGFGISNPNQAKQIINAGADGVIIGSAIVKLIEKNLGNKEKMLYEIKKFATSVKNNISENTY